MKFIQGNYTKADGTMRAIDVMVMNSSKEDFNGIDMTLLTDDEKTQVMLLTEQYEDDMKPYAKKAFRTMKHTGVEKPNAGIGGVMEGAKFEFSIGTSVDGAYEQLTNYYRRTGRTCYGIFNSEKITSDMTLDEMYTVVTGKAKTEM